MSALPGLLRVHDLVKATTNRRYNNLKCYLGQRSSRMPIFQRQCHLQSTMLTVELGYSSVLHESLGPKANEREAQELVC